VRILAIDPGPQKCGVVLYDTERRRVLEAWKARPVPELLDEITLRIKAAECDLVACERVQSYGISGSSLLYTAEVFGRVRERAILGGCQFVWLTRRDVLLWLDLLGAPGNRDAAVRARMIEMHGGERATAIGTKRTPGALYGVSSHAWQALGLAVAVAATMHPERSA